MGMFSGVPRSGRDHRGHRRVSRRFRCVELLENRLLPATLTVNTMADDNTPDDTLSLREAIEVSNGTLALSALSPAERAQVSESLSDPNTIAFDINSPDVPVIAPTLALPEITAPVSIDGTTQPVSEGVVIDGAGAGAGVDGLTISGGYSVVIGLGIAIWIDPSLAPGLHVAGSSMGSMR